MKMKVLLAQFSSVAQSCLTLCDPNGLQHTRLPCRSPTPRACSCPSSPFIESVMPSNHLILSRPLLLLPSTLPSIRVFSKESVLHIRWPKYWSFSFSISSSNEYSRRISFRIDRFDLPAIQGTLKSLVQHHTHSVVSNALRPPILCEDGANNNALPELFVNPKADKQNPTVQNKQNW